MSVVKVIHVVKYLDKIKRDVSELTEIASFLDSSRCYHDNVKIAIEQQINVLLNEKNKVIGMDIQEADQKIQDTVLPNLNSKNEIAQKAILESNFSLEAFEEDFLTRKPIKRNFLKMLKEEQEPDENLIIKKVAGNKYFDSSDKVRKDIKIKKIQSTTDLEEEIVKFPALLNKRGQKTLDSIKELTNLNLSRSEILDRLPQID